MALNVERKRENKLKPKINIPMNKMIHSSFATRCRSQ